MFRVGEALNRRVSISHRDGNLVISIQRNNYWLLYIMLLLFFTGVFLVFFATFLRGLLRIRSAIEILYVLPFFAFILLWYTMAVRIGLWRAFGVEEIVIEHGHFQWCRAAGKWRRRFEASLEEISHVEAKTPWHSLSNRVEFTCKGHRYTVGDMLLQDEAKEIADEVKRITGLHAHS